MSHTVLQHSFSRFLILPLSLVSAVTVAYATGPDKSDSQLLSGNRVLLGTVEEVRSDQARIETGEGQPRFIPMNVRKDKALPDLKKGDLVEVTVNDQNLLVDVHKAGESSHHRIVRGQVAHPLETGHDKAVIRTEDGKEESHAIRPVTRSKVASIPVGAPVIFLMDELGKIVDVTFGSTEAVHRSAELSQKKSPLKGNLNRIVGVISKPLEQNRISIRRQDGTEQSYPVRPLVQERLGALSKGDTAVLLVDEANTVTDVAFVPGEKQ